MKTSLLGILFVCISCFLVNTTNALWDVKVDTDKIIDTYIDASNFNTELQYAREEYLEWKNKADTALILLSEYKKIKKIKVSEYTQEKYSINFSLRRQQVNTFKYQCQSYAADEMLLNDKLKELRAFSKKVSNKSKLDIEFLDKTTRKNFKLFFSKKWQCSKLTKELDRYLKLIELFEKKTSLVR